MQTISNSQEFVKTYNQIEKYVKDLAGVKKHQPFWVVLNKAGDNNRVVRELREDLLEYSRLRNAIVHSGSNQTMAEPHDEAVTRIKKIYEVLIEPPTAGELFKKKVYTCSPSDRLMDIVDVMRKFDYTQVPIYEDFQLLGLLTENVVVKIFSDICKTGKVTLTQFLVRDAMEYTKGQFYRIVSEDTDAYTILDYFLEFVEKEERLECVLVTRTGETTLLPSGIATTWDVPLIKKI